MQSEKSDKGPPEIQINEEEEKKLIMEEPMRK